MAFEKPVDEKIKKLAEMLKTNGLAHSDSQAMEMALSMSDTVSKVQKTYDEQKNEVPKGTTNTEEIVSRVESEALKVQDEPVPEEINLSKVDAEDVFKQQEALIKNSFGGGESEKTVKDIMDEEAKKVYADQSNDIPEDSNLSDSQPEPVRESHQQFEHPEIVIQDSQSEQISEQTSKDVNISKVNSETDSKDISEDKKDEVEEDEEKDELRKEVEEMAESKIDLSDVFNFNK